MGWENRNGRLYFYRKRRDGKRVVSEYVGTGLVAELSWALDGEEKHNANLKRIERDQRRQAVKMIDDNAAQVEKYTKIITRACLLLADYHAPKRQWRKVRNGKK
jgi:hypothetical protein